MKSKFAADTGLLCEEAFVTTAEQGRRHLYCQSVNKVVN